MRKLAQDCCKYGDENQSTSFPLASASLHFGMSHCLMEEGREALLGILGSQVILCFFHSDYQYFYTSTSYGTSETHVMNGNFSFNLSDWTCQSSTITKCIHHIDKELRFDVAWF